MPATIDAYTKLHTPLSVLMGAQLTATDTLRVLDKDLCSSTRPLPITDLASRLTTCNGFLSITSWNVAERPSPEAIAHAWITLRRRWPLGPVTQPRCHSGQTL